MVVTGTWKGVTNQTECRKALQAQADTLRLTYGGNMTFRFMGSDCQIRIDIDPAQREAYGETQLRADQLAAIAVFAPGGYVPDPS